jgi:hypothetical protein
VAIDAQGIGQTPSVHMVGFVAAGHFALAVDEEGFAVVLLPGNE